MRQKKIFCFNDDELVRKKFLSLLFAFGQDKSYYVCFILFFTREKREGIFLFVTKYTKRPAVGNEPQHLLWRQREQKKKKQKEIISVLLSNYGHDKYVLTKSRQFSLLLYFIVPLNDLTSHQTFPS